MHKKRCPFCGGNSYSAAPGAEWECPYCGANLLYIEAVPAGIEEENNENTGDEVIDDIEKLKEKKNIYYNS
ncbi:MAG: hypothetical protein K9L17_09885 [Clostridiales bacterium]|nr:hypothetical protein [Clostridiales bacterium]MCF8022989.1 hypothetical protein [Clostridiales bacterium]